MENLTIKITISDNEKEIKVVYLKIKVILMELLKKSNGNHPRTQEEVEQMKILLKE
jgi:hypothetical protein